VRTCSKTKQNGAKPSTITKQFKKWVKSLYRSTVKRIYGWQRGTWQDAPHLPLGKCKLQQDTATLLEWLKCRTREHHMQCCWSGCIWKTVSYKTEHVLPGYSPAITLLSYLPKGVDNISAQKPACNYL
jgi:hypothetical protein